MYSIQLIQVSRYKKRTMENYGTHAIKHHICCKAAIKVGHVRAKKLFIYLDKA